MWDDWRMVGMVKGAVALSQLYSCGCFNIQIKSILYF